VHVGQSGNLYRRERQNRSLRTGNVHRGEEPPEKGFSWRSTFKEQLRRLYPALYAGERPVGCCGGRKSRKAAARSQPRAAASLAARQSALAQRADGMVWLEYIGGNGANQKWRGPETGTVYVFGGKKAIGQVRPEDAAGMLDIRVHTLPMFRLYKMDLKQAEAVTVPKTEAARANPPQPDDLTAIRGVGAATAGKLRGGGYATFLALAKAQVDEVATRAGIPVHLAQKAIAGARSRA
jgi:hypothetical protein